MLVTAQQRDRGVALSGHRLGVFADADLGAIFLNCDVAEPLEWVFMPPAQEPGERGRGRGPWSAEATGVDDLDALLAHGAPHLRACVSLTRSTHARVASRCG